MPHWLPAVLFGTAIAVFGLIMWRLNRRAWQAVHLDHDLNSFDSQHLRNRYSRRCQLSGMLVTIGLMIALGDLFVWNLGAAQSTVYWIVVIMLGCWMGLLAVGDLTSVHAHSQVLKKRVDQQRQQLEEELAELRRRSGQGG